MGKMILAGIGFWILLAGPSAFATVLSCDVVDSHGRYEGLVCGATVNTEVYDDFVEFETGYLEVDTHPLPGDSEQAGECKNAPGLILVRRDKVANHKSNLKIVGLGPVGERRVFKWNKLTGKSTLQLFDGTFFGLFGSLYASFEMVCSLLD